MSAMIRASRAAATPGKARRTRSFSLSDESTTGYGSDDAGCRLSAASMDDSPHRVRFSPITQEFGKMSIASSDVSSCSDRDLDSVPFELGDRPSGDVFETSPLKTALKPNKDATFGMAPKTPIRDIEERRQLRSVTAGNALMPVTPYRTGHEISGVDPQGLYPPSACVFVANLPEGKDDRALEAAVTREFSRFGTVFVKIRREGRGTSTGMPYAFAQYTNDEDAKTAVEQGRGIVILGRPCRTEKVKANRTFVMYSRRGDDITTDIAREILEPYGELSKCEPLSLQMQQAMNIPSAVLVEFAKFDPKRDLNSAVRQHDGFRIDAFDVKKKNFISRTDADEEFLRKYDVDRRSVFVGNLPSEVDEDEIMDLFSDVGEVLDATIVKRTNGAGVTKAFGFVEFARADMPDRAVQNFNQAVFRGEILRVERKVFRHLGTPRRVKSQAFNINTSTTPKTPARGHFSAKKDTPGRVENGYPYNPSPLGQAFVPFGYPAPSPTAPADGHPMFSAAGIPITPTGSAFAPNPFTYAGGYWPGMSMAQDPVTGHTFYTYTPPVASAHAARVPETPTRVPETPTRVRTREHHYHHKA
ncbi:uncharacterized protein B0T15DRAFT_548965 [Chaetomium strumarium]|uniref:RRM domain-containing protein n=1 Tax=Chaetomium strumarium TaxID=1170767 RepID=A0AAJ0M775_9PEZI|nr:hypothetical protein B0T15DRAFT_548965 [Chaetomium strumarium]